MISIILYYGILAISVAIIKHTNVHTQILVTGFPGVYVACLVDDIPSFLDTFSGDDFTGFSVTIPHKVGKQQ